MNQIRPNIWIGSAQHIYDEAFLKANGITAILNVAYDVQGNREIMPESIRQVKIGLGDYTLNKPYMKDLAVQTLKSMLYHGEIVLVHCAAGASRSVWVVCKALADLEGTTPGHVLEEVKSKREQALYGPLF